MTLQVHCPNPACGKPARVPEEHLNRTARCPTCRTKFKVSDALTGSRSVAASVAAAPAKVATDTGTSYTLGPAASVASDGSLPAQIGRFQIRSRLGVGAFGTVYRAFDPQLEREVALKVPQAATLESPQAIERFLREAKAAAGLWHPHIVPVYDAGQDGDLYYIASAFIAGRTLADAIRDGGLDVREAARVVYALAEALAYAHGQRIVHRDVKPANVMLDIKGAPHLMDFGLAYQQDAAQKLTQDGTLLGTPAYMAPEQAQTSEQAQGQSDKHQPATDQYSLGVVLYELLCGQTPFGGPVQIVLYNAIHKDPPLPRSVKAEVPLDLETICLKALTKRPESRYASCQEMADDLQHWLDGEPIQARRIGLVERVERWARREPLLATTMAVAIFCLVLVALGASVGATLLASAAEAEREARETADHSAAEARKQAENASASKGAAEREAENARQANAQLQVEAQKAKEAGQRAQTQAEEARKAREIAERETKIAQELKQEAERAKREAEERERLTRHYLYISDMNLAQQAWDGGDFVRLNELLSKHRPEKGQPDFRSFDWYYQQRQAASWRPGPKIPFAAQSIMLSPDEKSVYALGVDGSLCLIDRTTGKFLLPLGSDKVWALSQDARRAAVAAADGTLGIKDVASGKLLVQKVAANLAIRNAVFSPDSRYLAILVGIGASSGTGTRYGLQLLDLQQSKSTALEVGGRTLFSTPATAESALLFSPNGKTLAVLNVAGNNVELWDIEKVKRREAWEYDEPASALAFSPDSVLLAITSTNLSHRVNSRTSVQRQPGIEFRDVVTDTQLSKLTGNNMKSLSAIVFSSDGRTLFTSSDFGEISCWDVESQKQEVLFQTSQPVKQLLLSKDRKYLVCNCFERLPAGAIGRLLKREAGFVQVWRTLGQSEGAALKTHKTTVGFVAVSENGTKVVSTGGEGSVAVSSTDSAKDRTSLSVGSEATALALSADGSTVYVARATDYALLERSFVDKATGKVLGRHKDAVTCLALSPDNRTLASASRDRSVRLWDLRNGQALAKLGDHSHPVLAVAFAPDGKTLASAGEDKTVLIWDLESNKQLYKLEVRSSITSLGFSPDGRFLVTGCWDHSARLWDLATKKVVQPFRGHRGAVLAVAFCPDGKTIVTGSKDGMIRIWDVSTGHLRLMLKGHEGGVHSVAFSRDGKSLATGGADKQVRYWRGSSVK